MSYPCTRDQLREQQESDPLLSEVLAYLKSPERQDISPAVREVLRDTGTISVDENTGLLMHKSVTNGRRHYVPILPPISHIAVMKALHARFTHVGTFRIKYISSRKVSILLEGYRTGRKRFRTFLHGVPVEKDSPTVPIWRTAIIQRNSPI